MEKYLTTKKRIYTEYDKILCVPYCGLQDLLYYVQPFAYATRAEGWACDFLDVEGVAISTGYAPAISKGRGCHKQYERFHEYNEKAREIRNNFELEWNQKKAMVNELLHEFISVYK